MSAFNVTAVSAAVVAACVGWGRLVEAGVGRWGDEPRLPQMSTGIAAALGLATGLCAGLFTVAVGAYAVWMAWLWVAVGCALAIRQARRPVGARGLDQRLTRALVALALAAIAVVLVARAGSEPTWNLCDDYPAYVAMADRLDETGNLDEPFSQRRIATLGGATVLQAFFAGATGIDSLYAADVVVGGLLVALLLLPLASSPLRLLLGACLVALFVVVPTLRANLSPTYLVVPLIGAAILTVARAWAKRPNELDRRVLVLVGLLAAGLLTLRVPFAAPIVFFGLTLIVVGRAESRERWRAAGLFALAVGAPAVGGFVALWRSSGTPVYPPFQGNFSSSWPGFREPGADIAAKLEDTLSTAPLGVMVALAVVVPLGLAVWRRRDVATLAPLFAVPGLLVTLVALVFSLSRAQSYDIARYSWPIVAGVLVAGLVMLADAASTSAHRLHRVIATLIVLGCLAAGATAAIRGEVEYVASAVTRVWFDEGPEAGNPWASVEADYRDAQAALPVGAKVLTASDFPHLFDYERNEIQSLDFVGSVSPPPGMPLNRPRATMAYLRSEGFEFVAATQPASSGCLYNVARWQEAATVGPAFALWLPYFRAWSRWLRAQITQHPERVYGHGSLVTVDLRDA